MATKTKAKLVKQIGWRPGRYFNKLTGAYDTVTPADTRAYVEGTKKLIKAGYEPPVLLNHAELGSGEGAPKSRRQAKADELRNSGGWLKDVAVGSDGAVEFSYEVTDPAIAAKLKDGSIKFVSPETRKSWSDGNGTVFQNIFSHLALTHRPRSGGQSTPEVTDVQQYSLEDWEPVQFADDDDPNDPTEQTRDEEPRSAPKDEEPADEGNPDIPGSGDDSKQKRRQRIEALLHFMEKLGVALPADTVEAEEEQFLDRLLTAMQTANRSKELAKEEATAKEDDMNPNGGKEPQVVEQRGVMQYSLEDLDNGKCPNKLLGRVIRQEHETLVKRLDALAARGYPAIKKKLLDTDGAMQFSTEGEFASVLSLTDVVSMFEECLPKDPGFSPELASQFAAEEHPDGEKHYIGDGPMSPEAAKKFNDDLAKQNPGMFRQTA